MSSELPNSVRTRMAAQQAQGEHLEADRLSAFAEGALDEPERESVFAHLAVCGECREVLALITPAEGPPVAVPVRRRSWLTLPRLRWAAAVAAIAVIFGVVMLHRERALQPRGSDVPPPSTASAPAPQSPSEEAKAAPVQGNSPVAERKLPAPKAKAGEVDRREAARASESGAAGSGGTLGKLEDRKSPPVGAPGTGHPESSATADKATGVMGAIIGGTPRADMAVRAQAPAQKMAGPSAAGAMAQGQAAAVQSPSPLAETRPGTPAKKAATVQTEQDALSTRTYVAGAAPSSRILAKREVIPPFRWAITPDGKVQRIFADGTAQTVAIADVSFRAVAAIGNVVWAGGNGGALFQSVDGGASWLRAESPTAEDIVGVAFSNQREGTLRTSGEQFATVDGGKSWKKVTGD